MDKDNNTNNSKRTKVELDTNLVNELIKLKKVGDTYSDIIWKLLKK